ncbi:MAG TPA: acetyl-CoA carboxylase biotin carboxyl carrier protein subunit [Porphyromonadaceae bacterium]|nr:acetyl-CoA carboxylase biotin carboxyl carrier protein subunit [Porphyromonadaceae bacterium]
MKQYKYIINGNEYNVTINSMEDNIAEVEVNGTPYKVEMEKPAKKTLKKPHSVISRPAQTSAPVAAAPVAAPSQSSGAAGAVRSPLPGVILEVSVKVGDVVKRGQKIAILEAMKMENNINADRDGKIIEVKVNKGDSVLEGADLIVIG